MPHATESDLRRLEDEPLAVPDRVVEHLESCARCRGRLEAVASDADRCAGLLSSPQPTPDLDAAWQRLAAALAAAELDNPAQTGDRARRSGGSGVVVALHAPRLRHVSVKSGIAAGAAVVVLAGTAAAATITTVFAPTKVAPLSLGGSDVGALADFMGLGTGASLSVGQTGHSSRPRGGGAPRSTRRGAPELGGFTTTHGSVVTRFGTIHWSSSGPAEVVSTLAEASRAAGFDVRLPSRLPSGVGSPEQFVVQPRVEVTVTLDRSLPQVGGSTIVLDAGPAVLAAYGASGGGPNVPTLGILAMPRPVATSTGATTSQLESFLLAQPGFPSDLAQELRLMGDVGTTLPVPVPPGAVERSVEVHGAPGVLVAEASNLASGVVWEDSSGMLHAVAGLVDQQDALGVADQLG